MIVSDPTETVLSQELPALIRGWLLLAQAVHDLSAAASGRRPDARPPGAARRERAMVSVHAENDAMLAWTARRLLERGHRAPKFHAISHPRVAEAEAVSRLIAMAALVDQPIVVFHVTTEGSMHAIRDAQTSGQKVFAETCPQYLLLDASTSTGRRSKGRSGCSARRPGMRRIARRSGGASRTARSRWSLSDHAPYRFDQSGKLARARPTSSRSRTAFPGSSCACRCCSPKVAKGRIDLERFVALGCTNPARIYGLHPKKARSRSSDADLAIWDLQRPSRSRMRPPTTPPAIAPMRA